MTQTDTLDVLKALEGKELAPSDWIKIDQERISQFAACTDDDQFIHTDPERASAAGLDSTIAHGFLSLSLTSAHNPSDFPILKNVHMYLNYGLDRVRFLAPVKVDSRVRFLTKVLSVTEKKPGRILIKSEKTLQVDGQEQPAMVAETLAMVVSEGS